MSDFEKYRQDILRERFSASVLMMAIPLYLSFSILDWVFAPQFWSLFFMVRVMSCVVFAIFAYALSKDKQFAIDHIVLLSHFVTATLGVGIGFMCYKTGGLASPYYAGLNWITIGSLAFWPVRPKDRLISIATIYAPIFLFEIIYSGDLLSTAALLSITFMAGTCMLALISNILSMASLKREYDFRDELQNLIRDKDAIIEIKSGESATLKRLAKQFSQTVIEAIEAKIISLDQRKRSTISIIFIDVVESTKRSNLLDHMDYQKAMDMFFELAIKILLKRNITMANFMGDGLMAIVNAPYSTLEHERVALEAAIEIIEAVKKKHRSFRELWHDNFEIRIGISSGLATVGFFPNSDFGVYTAVGDSVNLAARLCRAAENSTVATTKSIIVSSANFLKKCKVKRGGSIADFKGFSGIDVEYYITTPNADVTEVSNNFVCPLCSSELKTILDLEDCVVVKCVSCRYSDIHPKLEANSAA